MTEVGLELISGALSSTALRNNCSAFQGIDTRTNKAPVLCLLGSVTGFSKNKVGSDEENRVDDDGAQTEDPKQAQQVKR